jgi:hypothetical protein
MTSREKRLQIAVDNFLAPIYADVGRLIEEGGDTPLADVLMAYGVPITCADLQSLYDESYPPELDA